MYISLLFADKLVSLCRFFGVRVRYEHNYVDSFLFGYVIVDIVECTSTANTFAAHVIIFIISKNFITRIS